MRNEWWGRLAAAVGVAAGLAAVIVAARGVTAAQAQERPPQQPTFRTAANYVRVDVYPTKDGAPVTDLTAAEFQVFEDGVPQKVEGFERVAVRAAGSQEARVEPNTVGEANRMAQDPRSRLFVLFLDTYHVTLVSAIQIRGPITRMLERIIGQDDLVAVMTPEMSARAVTFARRTTTIDGMLEQWWDWGRRHTITQYDPQEEEYIRCYPPEAGEGTISSIAREMIARRREKMTLDAFEDLVIHLEGVREERKAVVTISEGWQLYTRNRALAEAKIPEMPGVFIGPGGKLMVGDDPRLGPTTTRSECDRDRLVLAEIDNDVRFRALLNQANRANVSFYPVDPRGLPVFDSPIGPDRPPPLAVDQRNLSNRIDTLKTLAENTDGLAIVNSNDLDSGLKRIVDDLTSYYLLGYYSTNTKPDGKYRRITVRVTRPGVNVRARPGYQAVTVEELAARDALAAAAAGPSAPTPLATALAALATRRPEAAVRVRTGYSWQAAAGAAPAAAIWVVGELDAVRARDPEWQDGAQASITVTPGGGGDPVASSEAQLSRAERHVTVTLAPPGGLPAGDYTVRVTWRGPRNASESFRMAIPGDAETAVRIGQPMYLRRGPFTGAALWVPTADAEFRRQERIRLDLSVAGPVERREARLLDRTGQPMAVPVTAGEREEGGVRYVTAELVLAPLARGDYVIEITVGDAAGEQKVLAGFRVVS